MVHTEMVTVGTIIVKCVCVTIFCAAMTNGRHSSGSLKVKGARMITTRENSLPLHQPETEFQMRKEHNMVELTSQEQKFPLEEDLRGRKKRGYEYMALDSYANTITEDYCPPSSPSPSRFSVFGFLSMMVSITITVANVLNAINNNNNNNDNNDNNNNDNNNNNNGLSTNGGNGDGGGGNNDAVQPQNNVVPVRINQVGQQNANADLGADGVPVLTATSSANSNPNTISFGGKNINFDNNSPVSLHTHSSWVGRLAHNLPYVEMPLRDALKHPPRPTHTYSSQSRQGKNLLGLKKTCSCSSKSTARRIENTFNTSEGNDTVVVLNTLDEREALRQRYYNILQERKDQGGGEGRRWQWSGCLLRLVCEQDLEAKYTSGLGSVFVRMSRLATQAVARRVLTSEGGTTLTLTSSCSNVSCPPLSLLLAVHRTSPVW
ncbi:probable serine/threonine-protein kinase DDB_G0282963 [Homarus americanus]|uniref:probable serine/threonine-protein kinase DDB_G0282963 n=1 Tax=Homarus americanus TaxID=6706 RepID=UPI001C496949|nr:probable serine/threonine-protein kinase DDB_G0282963 [Homarus americanus]